MRSKIPQIEVDFTSSGVKLRPLTVWRFQSIAPQDLLTLYLRKYEAIIATELCRKLRRSRKGKYHIYTITPFPHNSEVTSVRWIHLEFIGCWPHLSQQDVYDLLTL